MPSPGGIVPFVQLFLSSRPETWVTLAPGEPDDTGQALATGIAQLLAGRLGCAVTDVLVQVFVAAPGSSAMTAAIVRGRPRPRMASALGDLERYLAGRTGVDPSAVLVRFESTA